MKLSDYADRTQYIEEEKEVEDVRVFEDFVAFIPKVGEPFFLKSSEENHLQLFSLKNQDVCILRHVEDKKQRVIAIKGSEPRGGSFRYSPYLDETQKKFQRKRDLGDILLISFFFLLSLQLRLVSVPFLLITSVVLVLLKGYIFSIEKRREVIIGEFFAGNLVTAA